MKIPLGTLVVTVLTLCFTSQQCEAVAAARVYKHSSVHKAEDAVVDDSARGLAADGGHQTAHIAESAGDAENNEDDEVAKQTPKLKKDLKKQKQFEMSKHKTLIRELLKRWGPDKPKELKPGCSWQPQKFIIDKLWMPQARKLKGFDKWEKLMEKMEQEKQEAKKKWWKKVNSKFWVAAAAKYKGTVGYMNEAAKKYFWEKKKKQWKAVEAKKPTMTKTFFIERAKRKAIKWESFSNYWSRAQASFWTAVKEKQKTMTKKKSDKYFQRMQARWGKAELTVPKIKKWWTASKELKDRFENHKNEWWKKALLDLEVHMEKTGEKRVLYMYCTKK
eukprot:TRINITY_DN1036_c0_g1_i2.p1 TRINITY_DN1036_c0_g1~~TRINITY_DN1036_c0_g1_i2.p1  ORF type:complete len:332 (-),score=79.06 TRINITY_DN1036_c0_g1_i2:83-1078(-)